MPFHYIRINCPEEAFEVLDNVLKRTHHFHIRPNLDPAENYLIFIRESDCQLVRDFARRNHYPFELITESVLRGTPFAPGSYTHRGDPELAGWL